MLSPHISTSFSKWKFRPTPWEGIEKGGKGFLLMLKSEDEGGSYENGTHY